MKCETRRGERDRFLEQRVCSLKGHLLVEGVPGLAKTLTVKTLSTAIHGGFGASGSLLIWLPPDPGRHPCNPSWHRCVRFH